MLPTEGEVNQWDDGAELGWTVVCVRACVRECVRECVRVRASERERDCATVMVCEKERVRE